MSRRMPTKEQQQEYTMNLVRELKKMPDCVCGHPRIKHGVYCETSCVGDLDCGCYEYRYNTINELETDD